MEQIYDENGNLINPDSDPGASYPQTQEPPLSRQYRNGLHLVENKKAAAGESDDMSQYNTINLQKVVAESMKELFPDDDEDMFAEDREKYNSGEDIKGYYRAEYACICKYSRRAGTAREAGCTACRGAEARRGRGLQLFYTDWQNSPDGDRCVGNGARAAYGSD